MEETQGTAAGASGAPTGQASASPAESSGNMTVPPETELDENGKPLPFDQHPKWKSARQAEKKLQQIMSDNEVDSLEELTELIASGRKVTGKISDLENIDELITKAQKLDEWVDYYNRQAELAREQEETPEETADRLRRENAELKSRQRQQAEQKRLERENEMALNGYLKSVKEAVEDTFTDLPKEQRAFVAEFFGVDNPFTVIDIADKKAVRKMVGDGSKKIKTFIEGVRTQAVKDYIAGKMKIPHTTSTGEGSGPLPEKINLKTARAFLRESFRVP